MVLDEYNCAIINTKCICFHDDILTSFTFERERKCLILELVKFGSERSYKMIFNQVMGFKMTSCDFWGASQFVFDYVCVPPEEWVLIPELIEQWSRTPNSHTDVSYNNYLETLFEFSSGDQLRIVCKTIEIS